MVSRFQPSRLLSPFVVLAVIAGVSYWLNPGPWQHLSGATKAIFIAAALLVAVVMMALRKNMYLRIDERGLEVKYAVGAAKTYSWSDIESASIVRFTFLRIPMTSSVHLRLRPDLRSANVVRRAASAVTTSDASFPALFDESAEEIVEKIEFFKRESMNAGREQFQA